MRVIAIFLALLGTPAFGATFWHNSVVERTLTTGDEKFGGCLVSLAESFEGATGCKDPFLSADCAGVFGTKSAGARRMDQLTLAAVTGRVARVQINNGKRVNGWCTIDAVQIIYSDTTP